MNKPKIFDFINSWFRISEMSFNQMLKNIGIVKMTMLTVIVSILLSSGVTAIVLIAFKRGHVYFGMFTASTCAIVIATPVSYYFFKIMEKLNTIQKMLMQKNQELADALSDVKELSGLLPICANCKKIRDSKGYWNQLESYIESHTDAQFSHGICDECADVLYGKYEWYKKRTSKKRKRPLLKSVQ